MRNKGFRRLVLAKFWRETNTQRYANESRIQSALQHRTRNNESELGGVFFEMSDEKMKKEGEEMFEEEERKAGMIDEESTSEEEEKAEVGKMKFLEYEGKEEIDIDCGIFVKDVGGNIIKVHAKETKGEVITLTDEDMSEEENGKNEDKQKEEEGTSKVGSTKATGLKLSSRVVDLMTKEIDRYQVKRRPLGLVAACPLNDE